jgi:large subunit ribosomal protein L6
MMVEIPKDVQVEVKGDTVIVSGKLGKLQRSFKSLGVKLEIKGNQLEIGGGEGGKVLEGTIEAHVKNMFKGVTEGFSHKLQAVHSHFPMSVEVKGDRVLIKNFIGEKKPRSAEIVGKTKVEAKGTDIFVSGPDKDAVGQTCANISMATAIKQKDSRVFQDGVYMVE